MGRLRSVVVLLLCLLLTSACVVVDGGGTGVGSEPGPAPQEAPDGDSGSAEERIARDVFDRVNDEREERGLEPLGWNDALAEVARDWSVEMSEEGRISHQDIGELMRSDERLEGFAGVGENVFTSSGPVPAGTIHAGWMRSDGHRVNVLNPGWDRIGIGVVCAEDGSVWATQQFGRTTGSDRPSVAQTTPPQEPIARPDDDGPSCG